MTDCPEEIIFSPHFVDLINKIIAFDPEDRLSLEELKAHQWTQGTVFNDKESLNSF